MPGPFSLGLHFSLHTPCWLLLVILSYFGGFQYRFRKASVGSQFHVSSGFCCQFQKGYCLCSCWCFEVAVPHLGAGEFGRHWPGLGTCFCLMSYSCCLCTIATPWSNLLAPLFSYLFVPLRCISFDIQILGPDFLSSSSGSSITNPATFQILPSSSQVPQYH